MTENATGGLPATELRKAPLPTLVDLLREQADVKYDVVVPAAKLRYEGGLLHVVDGAARFDTTPGGDLVADTVDAVLAPTSIFEDGIADRLGIPIKYLRRLRETGCMVTTPSWPHMGDVERQLLDLNVNGWLQEKPAKQWLIRAFRTDDPDSVGIARAFLSDRYAPMDNYDVLLAALQGCSQAGVDTQELRVDGDLTERSMRVRISAPGIAVPARELLANYRSPYSGLTGQELPLVSAGIVLGNSETGGGAFTVTPRAVFEVCGNGLTKTVDVVRAVHLGGRMEEGRVQWSEDTQRKGLELVTARARDAVATFMSEDYLQGLLDEVAERAGMPVTDANATIQRVAKAHSFSEEEAAGILDCFIKSGDLTAGGVMQAVTAHAQQVGADRAAELEDSALDVLATAAG